MIRGLLECVSNFKMLNRSVLRRLIYLCGSFIYKDSNGGESEGRAKAVNQLPPSSSTHDRPSKVNRKLKHEHLHAALQH